MTWFTNLLADAGFAGLGPKRALAIVLLLVSTAFAIILRLSGVLALAACLTLGALALTMEALRSKAKARGQRLAEQWPEIIDTIQSGVVAGLSLPEIFSELANTGPEELRVYFGLSIERLDAGDEIDAVLLFLKRQISDPNADRLFETLRIVLEIGGEGLSGSLRAQVKQLRADIALWGELRAKAGWVMGTAKIAVAAPWIVVVMLASKPENAVIYNSPAGASVLLGGLLVCALAYRLIFSLGRLQQPARIMAAA